MRSIISGLVLAVIAHDPRRWRDHPQRPRQGLCGQWHGGFALCAHSGPDIDVGPITSRGLTLCQW
jgi:hypothetical protein